MPNESSSGKKIQKIAGNHQKCWLWGRHAVTETLRAGKWLPLQVLLSDELESQENQTTKQLCQKLHIPVEIVSSARLKQLGRSSEHQGYLAKMPEFQYESLNETLEKLSEPLLLILDRIQDPHNFGAILRSAEVLGVDAVILGEREQVGVTTAVARSSAGAVNHLPVIRVDNLATTLQSLRSREFTLVGTSLEESEGLAQTDFRGSVGIVIGNEGRGVSDKLLRLCNKRIRIPQQGKLDSLNAAVAAGIIMYEASSQRHPEISPPSN